MAEPEDKDSELLEIQARFEAAKDHAQEWRREARDSFGFYAGDQWDEEDRQKLIEQQRVPITFNRHDPRTVSDFVLCHFSSFVIYGTDPLSCRATVLPSSPMRYRRQRPGACSCRRH